MDDNEFQNKSRELMKSVEKGAPADITCVLLDSLDNWIPKAELLRKSRISVYLTRLRAHEDATVRSAATNLLKQFARTIKATKPASHTHTPSHPDQPGLQKQSIVVKLKLSPQKLLEINERSGVLNQATSMDSVVRLTQNAANLGNSIQQVAIDLEASRTREKKQILKLEATKKAVAKAQNEAKEALDKAASVAKAYRELQNAKETLASDNAKLTTKIDELIKKTENQADTIQSMKTSSTALAEQLHWMTEENYGKAGKLVDTLREDLRAFEG